MDLLLQELDQSKAALEDCVQFKVDQHEEISSLQGQVKQFNDHFMSIGSSEK